MIHDNIETDHISQQDDVNSTTTITATASNEEDTGDEVVANHHGQNTDATLANDTKLSQSSSLISADDSDEILDLDHNITYQNNHVEQETRNQVDDEEESNSRDVVSPVSTPSPEILTFGDITREVKAQMLQDLQRVVNILLPKRVRIYLMEACKPVMSIAREATKTVYGMVRRYALQTWQGVQGHSNNNGGDGHDGTSNKSTASQDEELSRKVNSTS